jgi:PEP-CTERM motif-containing protein
MRAARALLAAILALVGMLSAAPANALAITLPTGSTPSSDLIINFDYGAAGVHPGPYVSVLVFLGFDPPFAGSTVAIDLFGDLNGVDLLDSSVTTPFFSVTNVYQMPGVFDGVFSIGVRSTAGTAELDFANSLAIWIAIDTSTDPPTTTFGQTDGVTGQIVARPVPEPGTLALITIALAALAARTRRENAPSSRS